MRLRRGRPYTLLSKHGYHKGNTKEINLGSRLRISTFTPTWATQRITYPGQRRGRPELGQKSGGTKATLNDGMDTGG